MGFLIYWIGIVFAGQALLAPTAISIFTGVLSYILVLIILKTPEVNKIIAMIKARVFRKA
jgi:hypothetical protein